MDFLEEMQSMSRKLYGKELTRDEIRDNFLLSGPERRASVLLDIDKQLDRDIEEMSLRRVSELMGLRRDLGEDNERARKAGR